MADVEKPEDKQTASEDAPAPKAKSVPKKKPTPKMKTVAKEKAAPRATATAASAQPSEANAVLAEQPGVEETIAAEGRSSPVAPETQVMEDRPPAAPPETGVTEDRPPAPSEAQVPEPKPAVGSEAKAEQARPAAVPPPLPAEKPRSGLSAALWGPLLIIGVLIYALADEAPMPKQAEKVQAPAVVATEDAREAAGATSEKDEAAAEVAVAPAAVAEGASQMPGEKADVPQFMPRDVELGPKDALSIPLAPSPGVLALPAPEVSEPSGATKAMSAAAVEQVPAVPLGLPEAPAVATMPEPPPFDMPGVPLSMNDMAKGLSAVPEHPEPPSFDEMFGTPSSYGPYSDERGGPGPLAPPGYGAPSALPGPGVPAYYPPRAGVMVGQDRGEPPPPGEEAWPWPGGPPPAGPWPGRYYPPPGPYTCSPAMGLCVAFFPYPWYY